MKRFTHLGRILSPALPAHRLILGLSAVAGVVALFYPQGRSPVRALFESAVTVFLVWAVVRELDPDHQPSALIAATGAGAVSILTGETSLAALAGLLFAARITARSVGLRPLLTDIVVVGVFAGIFARTPLTWATGLAVATAVALDTNLPEPAPQRQIWLAAAIGVAVTLSAVLSSALAVAWQLPGPASLVIGGVGLVAAATAPVKELRSVTDARKTPMQPERIHVAGLIAAGALTLGLLVGGNTLAEVTWPGWTAVAVSGVGRRWR